MVRADNPGAATNARLVALLLSVIFALFSAVHFASRLLGVNIYMQPVIRLAPERVDIGAINPGHTANVSVTVQNIGSGRLRLTTVKGSCDACIAVTSFPKTPIYSGESAKIQFQITAGDNFGRMQKHAMIWSNDWTELPCRLSFQWEVAPAPTAQLDSANESTVSPHCANRAASGSFGIRQRALVRSCILGD